MALGSVILVPIRYVPDGGGGESLVLVKIFYFFFNPHPKICLLILEGGVQGERDRENH